MEQLKKNIEEIKEKNQILDEISKSDELTQIYNRNKFMQIGQETFECYKEVNQTYWVIVLDIDNFHIINDTCGYIKDHTHSFEDTWSWNESTHYHKSACGHNVKQDEAKHKDDNNDAICDVCTYDYDHTHTYDEAWTSNGENGHWHLPSCGHTVDGTDLTAHADENNDAALTYAKAKRDELILSIIAERVQQPDCNNGFILDGVPRTLAQAEAMDAKGVRIDHVVSIEIDDAVIEGRMTGRRVCGKCGASYHITANPPKTDGICDQCGSELVIRKDDAPETVRKRLEVYHASTEVLKDYYAKSGKLRIIDGQQSIEDANRDILEAIGAEV